MKRLLFECCHTRPLCGAPLSTALLVSLRAIRTRRRVARCLTLKSSISAPKPCRAASSLIAPRRILLQICWCCSVSLRASRQYFLPPRPDAPPAPLARPLIAFRLGIPHAGVERAAVRLPGRAWLCWLALLALVSAPAPAKQGAGGARPAQSHARQTSRPPPARGKFHLAGSAALTTHPSAVGGAGQAVGMASLVPYLVRANSSARRPSPASSEIDGDCGRLLWTSKSYEPGAARLLLRHVRSSGGINTPDSGGSKGARRARPEAAA